ncbi:matrix metalloproteinase-24 [Lingula anatina]|uniref:Matrix metalloproteinase-24 n=1 Tax=Lingula anatina TaxID=7574 RepID=A0A1S3IGL5_LINAN|nr:matrix metalloproteinase-24 [Lingula anatina]|eukprot:XP_013397405.1 matrix metalloproteinase-24 [Lingula anatina]
MHVASLRLTVHVLWLIYFVNLAFAAKKLEGEEEVNSRDIRSSGNALGSVSFLQKFGYLPKTNRSDGYVDISSFHRALRQFQRMAHIPVTGELDAKTREMMRAPRCGMPDMDNSDPRGPQQFRAQGSRWRKTDLTWKVINYSPDLSQGVQRRAFYQAFEHWSKVTPLTFRETRGTADIVIQFSRYNHGDGYAFDGRGGILAHAFFPENGDTHFDEDETWTDNTDSGTNLMIVATHEFGHALGLSHSEVRGALMAPYYQGFERSFALRADDIRGIQSIYGPRRTSVVTRRPVPRVTYLPPVRPTRPPPPRPRPTQPPTGRTPSWCRDSFKFDAIMEVSSSVYYVFRSHRVFKLNERGLMRGYPKPIKSEFPNAPKNVGAAVHSTRTRYSYLFKGRYVWRYYGNRFISKTEIRDRLYPRSPQAGLVWSNGNIYLFYNSYYYQFDERGQRIAPGYPRSIGSYWRGIPSNVEAAVLSVRDRYTYFFKGKNYFKYDNYRRAVVRGYPRSKASSWMGCGRSTPK